jgi:hypothetical protein
MSLQSSWSAEHYEAEIARLKKHLRLAQEQLRLTNDKLEMRVRQARWEVADEALSEFVDLRTNKRVQECLEQIKRENAPKD